MSRYVAAILLVAALLSFATLSAQRTPSRPGPDFASFEAGEEVSKWKATGAATVAQSTDFPSWEAHSLRVSVPAGQEGGVETSYIPEQWHRFEALQFFAFAEQATKLRVELRDGKGAASIEIALKKGSNHPQIVLEQLRGASLRGVQSLKLSFSPQQATSIYLDRFRVTEYNRVLAKTGRMDVSYSGAIETPHFKWANPYAKGPVRVFIVPEVAHGRAAIELAQRLDSKLFTVTLGADSGTNRWGFGDFYGERGTSFAAPFTLAYTYLADDLMNGPEYDVMVLPGSRPWDEFPAVVRQEIRRRVQAGMGLVLIDPKVADPAGGADLFELSALRSENPPPEKRVRNISEHTAPWVAEGSHYITRNVPVSVFPFSQMGVNKASASGQVLLKTESGQPVLAVKEFGRGRVVTAAYVERGLIPLIDNQWNTNTEYRYWEYMYSLLARSVVWAAKKEGPVSIAGIRFDSDSDPRKVTISPEGLKQAGCKLEARIRDEWWTVEKQETRAAAPGQPVAIALPASPRGRLHFVDLVLKNAAGKVLDWGTATYRTEPPAEIKAIRFAAESFKLGEPVRGELEFVQPKSPGFSLRLKLFDNYGRLLDARTQPLAGGTTTAPFTMRSQGCLTRLAALEASIVQNGAERQKVRREVFVLQPFKWDHYDIVMYLFGADPVPGLWNTVQERLKDLHITTLSSYPLELSKHANFGVQAQTRISGQESPDGKAREPYLERKRLYAETGNKQYLTRLSCLNDPKYLEQEREEIAKLVKPWVPFSPMSYYIYEEPSLTCYADAMDLCFSPYCMAKMRDWLKREYGGLEAVNREWGTNFSRWEDVIPDDTYEAQKRGNFASWADHRTFMEKTYAGNYTYVRELLHEHDPQGLVLLSGTQSSSPHNGCDYYQLDQILGHLNPYTHEDQAEFHRSFNPKLRMSGGAGYGRHGRGVLYDFYSNLFHGFWAGSYVFWQYSTLNPDYTFNQAAKDMQTGFGEIKGGGVAQLIKSAARDNNGIAVHYSYPSIHGTWIPDGRTRNPEGGHEDDLGENSGPTGMKFRANRHGWVNALQDAGLQFDFLAQQQIEAGELLSRGFRVLVLPFSVAITDKEVREIRKFVEAGGVLVADGQAGVMDGHCKLLPQGSLDDVFGIRRTSPAGPRELANLNSESGIVPTTGKPMFSDGQVPQFIINSVGKGKAIYLNAFLAAYVALRRDGNEGEFKSRLVRAFERAGIRPKYRVLTAKGLPLRDYGLYMYQAGPARYLGLLKNDDLKPRTEPFDIALGKSWHVYDVRTKTYLGHLDRIAGQIGTAEPKLYALLPEPVTSVAVEMEADVKRGGALPYSISYAAGKGVDSVALVKVYRPDGKLVREYSEDLDAKGGKASGAIHFALNDPAGVWKVVVTDAISGKQSVRQVMVR